MIPFWSDALGALPFEWARYGFMQSALLTILLVTPLLALLGYARWPASLRVFFWTVVPLWFFIHAVGAVMAETRLLLVPQALIFIPGALASLVPPGPRLPEAGPA